MDNGKGSVLFPVFSFMRSQQILTILYDLFKEDDTFNIGYSYLKKIFQKLNIIDV